ncbi:lysophospholipase [bacterium]|nr:lysophospholipase [Flavobacteriales bacterium]MDA9304001.1 lysophospholipase [bacterium]
MRLKKWLKRLLILFILGGIAGYVITYHVAPYAIIAKHTLTGEIPNNDELVSFEKMNVLGIDSVQLDSYLVSPKNDSIKGIVILIHGIGSCKEQFIDLARKFADEQIGSFIFDLRAHGKSQGEYCTYGFQEKYDVQNIVSKLKSHYPNLPIGIIGSSLGGAVAIQALELDERIQFGVIECTFGQLDQIVFDYQKRFTFGVGFKFITDIALERAGEIADFDPEKIRPINSVKQIEQPMFIAHGDKDIHISPEYGKALYDNLASIDKHFELLKGADHNYIHQIGGAEYSRKVLNFINRQLESK